MRATSPCHSKRESSMYKLQSMCINSIRCSFVCICSYEFVWSPFLVSRTSLSKRLWAALRTGSDSVLTGSALPVSWFSTTPLRMSPSSSSPVSLSHSPLRPLALRVHVTLHPSAQLQVRPGLSRFSSAQMLWVMVTAEFWGMFAELASYLGSLQK